MTEENKPVEELQNILRLGKASFIGSIGNSYNNPWSPSDVDKLELSTEKDYKKTVQNCRFFYRHDPIASTTINKLVEIGISDLVFNKNGLSDNELKLFEAMKEKLKEFAEAMALEYLLSGLVIPEVDYAVVGKDYLKNFGVKRYESAVVPVSMWLRDPETVTINSSMISDKPSYFVEIPSEVIWFVTNNGTYKDGTKDPELFAKLKVLYPDFIQEVKNGATKVLLSNDMIFRRKALADSPYPIPYLNAALESLKHKRNLRRMDYSLAARVIEAIQLFKLGDKDFPVTEDDESQFDYIKQQMMWRNSNGRDVERVFQLFSNHTLNIEWIVPPVDALLNETKYKDVNQDIIFALGFPRILITGESERTGSSDPEFAMMSPLKTMDNFRDKIIAVLGRIVNEVAMRNNLKSSPIVRFTPINLQAFRDYISALKDLYDSGNLSRKSYADYLGYSWDDEIGQREVEDTYMKDHGIGEFAPQPFSPTPQNNNTNTPDNTDNNPNPDPEIDNNN